MTKLFISETIRFKDGFFEVRYQLMVGVGDRLVGAIGVAIDVTEQTAAKEALRQSGEKYRELVENINDVLYAIDREGLIAYISPVIESVLGYRADELIGKIFFDYIYRPDQPRLKSDFAKAIDVIGSPSEYRFLDKSGETKWCRVSSHPITEGREKIGIQGVLVDISRSKRLEEQLKKSQDSKELSDVTGNVEFILVVDDMPAQREIATSILDRLGYRSQAVASGEEAIEFVRQHTVDLVILDMIMEPGIDGYETYRQIRSIRPAQKAVIASGYSETERVRKTQDSGAGRYIKKPYTLAAIGSAIKEELQRKEKGVL